MILIREARAADEFEVGSHFIHRVHANIDPLWDFARSPHQGYHPRGIHRSDKLLLPLRILRIYRHPDAQGMFGSLAAQTHQILACRW